MVFATVYPADDPNRRAGTRYYGPNQWPDGLPGFRETVSEYMNTMTALGLSLLPAWAAALRLDPDFFAPYFAPQPHTYFRMSHYPPVPDLGDNEFGLGPHADTGFMTFLPQADVDGLEILDIDGNWFRPPRMDDAILVNTGQFLERWSNGRFSATPHRVIPPKDRDRYSIALFVNNAFEPLCGCLPSCHGPGNPPRHAPETYWDFYDWYISRAYPHYDEFHEGD
jgi:isopenicillin N synthase-like dioxygenase